MRFTRILAQSISLEHSYEILHYNTGIKYFSIFKYSHVKTSLNVIRFNIIV
jgi:hypothetical protein